MKEKIGMEKLIELLNEFRKEMGYEGGLIYGGFGVRKGDLNFIFNHSKFPFIKWLVENDKINLLQLDNRIALSMSIEFNKVERVLMALSISDTPIDLLCEILK